MTALLFLAAASLADPGDGTFVVDQTPGQVEASHARAIEHSLASLPWLARVFARPALRNAVWSCGVLSIAHEEGGVTVVCDDKDPISVPLDGSTVRGVGPSGLPFEVRAEPMGDDLGLRFENELGVRWTHFQASGDQVVCKRRVESASLPVPLEWEVAYRAE